MPMHVHARTLTLRGHSESESHPSVDEVNSIYLNHEVTIEAYHLKHLFMVLFAFDQENQMAVSMHPYLMFRRHICYCREKTILRIHFRVSWP